MRRFLEMRTQLPWHGLAVAILIAAGIATAASAGAAELRPTAADVLGPHRAREVAASDSEPPPPWLGNDTSPAPELVASETETTEENARHDASAAAGLAVEPPTLHSSPPGTGTGRAAGPVVALAGAGPRGPPCAVG